jgi:hypothetical protein
MKKIILFSLAICITCVFTCSKESTNRVDVDNSLMSTSKLKKLINSKESVKALIRKGLMSEVAIEVDSPGGPSDCPGDGVKEFANSSNLIDEANSMSVFGDEMRTFRDNYLVAGETGLT